MRKGAFWLCPLLLFLISCSSPTSKQAFDYVDPFIGTGGHGHTYPGATAPFGMVQLSPDTRLTGWDGCSGYHYTDSLVYGFSHTHLSGTGVSDYGDILLMPMTSALEMTTEPTQATPFDKTTETAEPGYYRCQLTDENIEVELTATERVGFHQYHFPEEGPVHLLLDLMHRDEVINAGFRVVNEREVEGFRISKAWALEQHVYFVMQFSRPAPYHTAFFSGAEVTDEANGQYEGDSIKAVFQFVNTGEPLLVKVGISAVDIAGARRNLEAEVPHWDFDRTRAETRQKWEQQLSRAEIESSDEDIKTNFYTALYHNFIVPNLFMDVDGRYRGTDLEIHQTDDHTHYTVFSLWDTYRATHPLYTILERERTNDFIRTFVAQYQQGGKLPMWELAGNYTGCMIGYHAVPVITDAYFKGIRDYDAELALEAMLATANADELGKTPYREYGFIPAELEHESVSKTLEYAYDDWCIAQLANALGQEDVYETFLQRAQSYKNLFDPETHLMRARVSQRWWQPYDPAEVNFNYTEANAWQYSFYVPQDVAGLAQLHGGPDRLAARLDDLFNASSETTGREQADITGLIGQYAHGNEPSHHLAYLYAYLGQPWKTQELVRRILKEQYRAAPDGLSGNEDCGQMSAWYVLSTLGFYPVNPADGLFVFGSPLVDKAVLHLENGRTFTVRAENQGDDHPYIQSIRLNGEDYHLTYLTYDDIWQGGELEFVMGPEADQDWGSNLSQAPPSRIGEHLIVPSPGISRGARAFFGKDTVALNCADGEAAIYYAFDGADPDPEAGGQPYAEPFVVDRSTELRAVAVNAAGQRSHTISSRFFRIPAERSISLVNAFAPHYSAGGDNALIDYIQGGDDFRNGDWQGYHGVDLDATVDLGKVQRIDRLALRCLQDENAWIFMPLQVRFFLSEDGRDFRLAGEVENEVSPRQQGTVIHTYALTPGQRARYLRVQAVNRGVCPDWHKGAGGKAWIFADEILINDEL